MRDLGGDLRYALRMLLKAPGLSLVVVLTLALAIGASTVGFTFANLLILKGLPIEDPDRVVSLFEIDPQRGDDRALVSLPDFLDYRERASSLEHLSAFRTGTLTLAGRGDPVRLRTIHINADFFPAWGLRTHLGRAFLRDEDRPGAPPVVLLAHGYWLTEFDADPNVLGRVLILNDRPHTIVGVMSPDVEFGNLRLLDVWTPLVLDPGAPRDRRTLRVSGRLRAGVALDRADEEIRAIAARLAEEHPDTRAGWGARLVPITEGVTGRNFWLVLSLLFVAVGFVLLIACANVANIQLARASGRLREMAVRMALGAGRLRLGRQVLFESLLLGLLGGAGGLLVAEGALRIIRSVESEPLFQQLDIDGAVLGFLVLLSLVAPIVFSLAPLAYFSRADLRQVLNDGGRRTTAGPGGRRGRGALVVAQLSLATALLILSGLAARSVQAIQRLDFGIAPTDVLMFRVELDEDRYAVPAQAAAFVDALATRLARLPGVARVGVSDRMPLLDREAPLNLEIDGRPVSSGADRPWAFATRIGVEALAALGIPVVSGRSLERTDGPGRPMVALVSREAARRYLNDRASPLGARLRLEAGGPWLEVVGLVADVRTPDENMSVPPRVYLPLAQHTSRALAWSIRTSKDPAAVAPLVRPAVSALDATLAVFDLEPFARALDREFASNWILVGLFGWFALVALALGATGLYGVVSFSVSQRTPEFGTRMALGADARAILRLVLRDGLFLLGMGLAVGLAGGLALGRIMRSLLFGVGPGDPTTFGAAAATLLAVTLLASLVPALRASRVDPLVALRVE